VCAQLLRDGCTAGQADFKSIVVKAAAAGQAEIVSRLVDVVDCSALQGTSARGVHQAISQAFNKAAGHGGRVPEDAKEAGREGEEHPP
jgi:hypothetical protein